MDKANELLMFINNQPYNKLQSNGNNSVDYLKDGKTWTMIGIPARAIELA